MQKTVAIYHRSVPNAKNQEKIDLLRFFSQGVTAAGDTAVDVNDYTYTPTDVAIIQGWVTNDQKSKGHLELRHQVITQQARLGKHTISADSNLFLYATPKNPYHYLRYSFDGIFPNTGNYCDTRIDPTRWQKLSQNLNITLKPYRTNGNHILICLQRNGGWSMGEYDVVEWATNVMTTIRKHSDRPIVIRPHPGDKTAETYCRILLQLCISHGIGGVSLSNPGTTLVQDLQNCWAAVNHNSSPTVGAAIEGVPIFVTDPERSQCREIANHHLYSIETPVLPDRQAWVERLAMSHWSFPELISGECWRHMREFI